MSISNQFFSRYILLLEKELTAYFFFLFLGIIQMYEIYYIPGVSISNIETYSCIMYICMFDIYERHDFTIIYISLIMYNYVIIIE